MKELINKVTVTGLLVKNDISEFKTNAGDDAIGGSLILRTADSSEIEVRFFAYKYKKDENKKFTSEESYFYEKYMDAMTNLKDIEHCSGDEKPDIVSITDGVFTVNDFKSTDGKVITSNKISAKFINKVEPKDYDTTVCEAKFEVEGMVESITDETKDNAPTGNLVIKFNGIRQRADGFGKDAKYEVDALIPIKFTVEQSMAAAFRSGGYYDGCWAKFIGKLVNTVETSEVVEKQAFGEDNVKKIKTYNRHYFIKSGNSPTTIFEHEITQEMVNALVAKRKQTIAEVMNGSKSDNSESAFPVDKTTTPAPNTNFNPFAQ